ncbi:MAG TPA: hypothetical protein VFN23_03375 [Ktedonobacteraceae bacterium]|nr:hypothetical protein [Ktedonobacteraceae bacterium]
MYGTLYHLRPRIGKEQAALDHLFRWEQEYLPRAKGYVGGYVLEPEAAYYAASYSIIVMVVFETQVAYARHLEDPIQELWDRNLRKLLQHIPEGHEGEITALFREARGI